MVGLGVDLVGVVDVMAGVSCVVDDSVKPGWSRNIKIEVCIISFIENHVSP